MGGWIKLHRKLRESPLYCALNAAQRDVFIQCLLMANHERKEWRWGNKLHFCEPGQFITSIQQLSKQCASDVKTQSIRSALANIEAFGFLTNESTKAGRLITICNWDTYQSEERSPNKEANNHPTINPTPNKKEEVRSKNSTTAASGDAGRVEFWLSAKKRKLKGKRLAAFKKFWKAYGFAKGRAGAIDSWIDIPELTNEMVKQICKAAEIEAVEREAARANGKIPIYAQGWITGQRWQDEPLPEPPVKPDTPNSHAGMEEV